MIGYLVFFLEDIQFYVPFLNLLPISRKDTVRAGGFVPTFPVSAEQPGVASEAYNPGLKVLTDF